MTIYLIKKYMHFANHPDLDGTVILDNKAFKSKEDAMDAIQANLDIEEKAHDDGDITHKYVSMNHETRTATIKIYGKLDIEYSLDTLDLV